MRRPMDWSKVVEGVPYDIGERSARVVMADMAAIGHDEAAEAWREFLEEPAMLVARVAVHECVEAISMAADDYDRRVLAAKATLKEMQESLKTNVYTMAVSSQEGQ